MEVHLCDGDNQGPFATLAAFQGGGIKGLFGVSDLRNTEIERADSGIERAFFESIGKALSCGSALIRGGLQMSLAFDEHGMINQEGESLRQALQTALGNGIENFVG